MGIYRLKRYTFDLIMCKNEVDSLNIKACLVTGSCVQCQNMHMGVRRPVPRALRAKEQRNSRNGLLAGRVTLFQGFLLLAQVL